MSYLSFKTCVTHHGPSHKHLFQGLLENKPKDLFCQNDFSYFAINDFGGAKNYREKFNYWMDIQISELQEQWNFEKSEKWGIVFASTKGIIEDLVWQEEAPTEDPYISVLDRLVEKFPVPVEKSLVVTNACTSSHGAIEMAQRWLNRGQVDHVFVFAADFIGPFTLKGFSSLRALSETKTLRPFDNTRDGLLLGDAAGSLVISAKPQSARPLKINPIYTLCEGVSATRPDTSGKNLAHCFQSAMVQKPDVLMAHGTGTFYNDLTESKAILASFSKETPPVITATKWSLGHGLGVSGLIDLCAASEIIERQTVPGISTLQESDLEISEWLVKENKEMKVQSLLLSSLGFGGVCSALQLVQENSQ